MQNYIVLSFQIVHPSVAYSFSGEDIERPLIIGIDGRFSHGETVFRRLGDSISMWETFLPGQSLRGNIILARGDSASVRLNIMTPTLIHDYQDLCSRFLSF